ncbi:hypothetical protein LJC27_04220 [Christensenellaceae bacterium OttesenSCG-928-M15]|nr:hypothetical protein [Christensenellaceae bacterium OttesenSCG-928-M15]
MNRRSVVFFPYRASSWDILESVWVAASKDVNCDVKVVPLPWYSWEKRGSTVDLHYEGGSFPEYVPITNYKNYDLAAKSIDIAFSDNPYDGNNDLFVLDKAYWSYELKKHVKKLVMIPSFGFGIADASYAIERCAADVFIAETEYYKWMKKLVPEKEVYLLGNPKFDKLFDTKHTVIPEEWTAATKGKSVFFLNMSIPLLKKVPEVFIQKLAEIVEYFGKNTDKYVLIWRPHPAMENMMERIQSNLADQYRGIVAGMNGNIIVDRTSTPYAAMSIADGYIGNDSSILFRQFALTGKPMFIISESVCGLLFLYHQVVQGSELGQTDEEWQISWNVNGLYRMYHVTENVSDIRLESSISFERNIGNLYNNFFEYDGKLMFAPDNAECWAEYDIATKQWAKFDRFERNYMPTKYGRGLNCAVQDERYLYFTPATAKIFARFDKRERKFEVFEEPLERFFELYHETYSGGYSGVIFNDTRKHVQIDDNLWLCSPFCNILCELNLKTMKSQFHRVGKSALCYSYFDYDGADFWLLNSRGGIGDEPDVLVKWNLKDKSPVYYEDLMIDKHPFLRDGVTFNYVCCFQEHIWLSPHSNKYIVRFDPRNEVATPFYLGNEASLLEKADKFCFPQANNMIIPTYCRGNMLGVYAYPDFAEALYDVEKCEFATYIPVKREVFEDLLRERESLVPGLWKESDQLNYQDFIRKISNGTIQRRNAELIEYVQTEYGLVNVDGTCGEEIWKCINW